MIRWGGPCDKLESTGTSKGIQVHQNILRKLHKTYLQIVRFYSCV